MKFDKGKIKKRREAMGLSLRDMAKLMNCSPQWLQKIESGPHTINIKTLERIMATLQIKDPSYFFKNDDRRKNV